MSRTSKRVSVENRSGRLILFSILVLALAHGWLYATFLPPWGVIDEAHHVDYIHQLAENGTIPVVGETYLSSEIVESLYATRRWETFHWGHPPSSRDARDLGFAGYSYEGYHPPLFYVLLAPLYKVLPGDVLVKLYILRLGMVGISLATIWMTFRIGDELFPKRPMVSYSAGALLALLPARTMSISRVNNDVLLEVIATAFVWICTRSVLKGLSVRRSQLLGLLLGLGTLTKVSMIVLVVLLPFVFWANRRKIHVRRMMLWTSGIALLMIIPLGLRNLRLYGDLTGFASFEALNREFDIFNPPRFTWASLLVATWSTFSHFWMAWWKGAEAATNPVVDSFYIVLAVLSGLSLAGLIRYLLKNDKEGRADRPRLVMMMYLFAIGSYAVAVLTSYFDGKIPVIQGRFLLPVVAPLVILLSWGLWEVRQGEGLLPFVLLVLVVMDALSLFGNLLPYAYYWSAFTSNTAPAPHGSLDWGERWAMFYQRFLRDKPPSIHPTLPGVLLLYLTSLAATGIAFLKGTGTGERPGTGRLRAETSGTF